MLCAKLIGFDKVCTAVSGGISDLLIFDPSDFNFTQAAPGADGLNLPYTAITLNAGATSAGGAKLFGVSFKKGEAEYTFKRDAANVSYTHTWAFSLKGNSQKTTQFMQSLDATGECCGLGVIFRTNDGKIWVAGEKFINNDTVVAFDIHQADSDGGSGKIFSDPNVANVKIEGIYSRNLYEYSGTWASILALK